MASHILVYLDQNYISNFAKARLGLLTSKDDEDFWRSLFESIRKAVLDDNISCPESEFHRIESSYDKRLEEAMREVIYGLSWGLRFREREDILGSQINYAARKFLGMCEGDAEDQLIAFVSDPQAPVQSRMQNILGSKGRINVWFSFTDAIVEHDRRLKDKYVTGQQSSIPICRNWDDELLAQKMSFIDSYFLGGSAIRLVGQEWCDMSEWDKTSWIDRMTNTTDLWNTLGEIGINIADTATASGFLKSQELLNIPYIDIVSSINTAIIKNYPNRGCRGSDLYDVIILSTVLPYCDVVTTDSFMKEILVKILHFDLKYKSKIFSATKADRLALQKFVRNLLE